MTNEQKQVKDWMVKFGQECPEKPVIPSLEIRKLRAKLILEEALETIMALGLFPYMRRTHYEDDMIEDDSIGLWEDPKGRADLKEIADGCEDLKVVTEGTLIACGLVKDYGEEWKDLTEDPLFNEVMRSNNSKMWQIGEHEFKTVKDSDGKVIKSPSYFPPNLQPIINELNNTK
jgi:predicted HAD superfamily Cof-like phosphohydrolase